ncbi:thioredoxin-like domain-containing protein [Tuwongella immobilis]|uniref:Thioredoxin domain-containing protein n=1 Tax=Tuwongella immobilis TaxID=692036 RepID=A0A6C2YIF7_9BACT|nr:thioredoxin-like domain-containing protein [Tuwongella immobilis]VIP00855.1 nhl repeat containing protein : NHL repeat containing protein OS=Planctomyces limnophilus (strain ATCC 43296 / DSM 3776 / IFAM 1008 / 290) GN=Plim_4099 PE=4 SV=1: Thioredoxin_8: NHL [Tuwongella immobilis]VTR97128.1 nhl repeat containing protein : NHL repeat containing protein OS=Planctomyces limnophilus (strain ATCC 43296 / DSM 3776 / IFAM 1008 / 290) GN=Plim_4099 PE=4 SV=1: Thioredoxin_8: NHL [Tuwongella immobilis]
MNPEPNPATPLKSRRSLLPILFSVGIFAGLLALFVVASQQMFPRNALAVAAQQEENGDEPQLKPAPELEGGIAWLNTSGPLTLKDLKGKIVVLDFWTYCCINCIHTLPDLAKLEKKYANQVVVIGVHSAKFDTEKDSGNIREAILRYEISHPVVNDAEMKIWNNYGVRSWPTLAVIDPEGNYLGQASGEGNLELLERVIDGQIKKHRAKKTLNEKPMRFDLIRFREKKDSPLFFPGKVLADEASKRLFIADSTNHRIVITDLDGNKQAIIGGNGPGLKDGSFAEAQFEDPQGMALKGDTLYIADRRNHCIRAADLVKGTVTRIAGTGEQNRDRLLGGEGKSVGLNSPWDLLVKGDTLFIAMAGHHQIWTMDLAKGTVQNYAGDGRENIKDGPLYASRFAQPSGLTTDGTNLYVADCEVSAIRKLPMDGKGRVETLIGQGLFEFGDIDGVGDDARLQHALAVAYHDGLIYVADTYNSKLKTIDPKTRTLATFIKSEGKDPAFNEPAGLSYAAGKLYVADTNAHRIRVVDLKTKAVSTLALKGVSLPVEPKAE